MYCYRDCTCDTSGKIASSGSFLTDYPRGISSVWLAQRTGDQWVHATSSLLLVLTLSVEPGGA